jgi:hypothetical protein
VRGSTLWSGSAMPAGRSWGRSRARGSHCRCSFRLWFSRLSCICRRPKYVKARASDTWTGECIRRGLESPAIRWSKIAAPATISRCSSLDPSCTIRATRRSSRSNWQRFQSRGLGIGHGNPSKLNALVSQRLSGRNLDIGTMPGDRPAGVSRAHAVGCVWARGRP